ncbi:uncharacterized protein LOC111324216 [Stylophora pistillata]|uniref:uncharacterized protein LOC111324216 n=1 Tax=Stylophora pistillata TaxID=50429 RepID=UPI000C04FF15|nr:uncharacterized protein LOC111324216 [Stylophora pistillata]
MTEENVSLVDSLQAFADLERQRFILSNSERVAIEPASCPSISLIMARCPFELTLKNTGRIAFGVILAIQAIFLACYSGRYKSCEWYSLFTVFLPAFCAWCVLLRFKKATLRWLLLVWILYIVALIVNIGIIFGLVGDKLGTKKFPSLGLLKGILCLTPALLLLLLHNADDLNRSQERKDLVLKLSFQMAIDLFDVIDMIDIVLDDIGRGNRVQSSCVDIIATLNRTLVVTLPNCSLDNSGIPTLEATKSPAIPPVFGAVMVGVACSSLLLSVWQWAENKLSASNPKIQFRTAVARNVLEVIFVNFFFLIIRGVVFFMFGQEDFVFIAKNFIAIFFSILEIHSLCESHSTNFTTLCKEEWRKCSARLREFHQRLKRVMTCR